MKLTFDSVQMALKYIRTYHWGIPILDKNEGSPICKLKIKAKSLV